MGDSGVNDGDDDVTGSSYRNRQGWFWRRTKYCWNNWMSSRAKSRSCVHLTYKKVNRLWLGLLDCCASQQWNSLPSDICHTRSSHAFRNVLQTLLCFCFALHEVMVHGCMVYTECAETAAVSCGTSHVSTVK